MHTRVDEIASRIYRFSTRVDGIVPDGFTFNQFLVVADEPLLFHCGMRGLFPLVSEAMKTILPIERLRWISFGHVEADECGAMNQWLAAAPHAEVLHGKLGCDVSIADLADRPPRATNEGDVIVLGDRRVRVLFTPHVPHGWESIVLHEEQTGTLLGGDLLTSSGDGPAITRDDPLDAILSGERMFRAWSLAPHSSMLVRRLADLGPRTIASMHGSSFEGDGATLLRRLATGLDAIADERRREASERPSLAKPPPGTTARASIPTTPPH